jgi:peptidyl-dipeptidase Dcp
MKRGRPSTCFFAFWGIAASTSLLAQSLSSDQPVPNAREVALNSSTLSDSATKLVAADSNPLLAPSPLPWEAPDFAKIKHEHFLPAYQAGIREQLNEVQAIASQSPSPTFANTIEALEKTGMTLTRVDNVFSNLSSAHTDEKIQAIEAEMAPKLAAHSDNILLDRKLFQRVRSLYEQRASLGLNAQQQQLLKEYFERFVRAGAPLDDAAQARIRAINEEQSSVHTKFQDNLLAITREIAVVVGDRDELQGFSDGDIAAAAQAAKDRGLEGKYLLNITNTTRQPILTSLQNRAVRERVWRASAHRGLGQSGGIDNRPLVLQLAKLRAERAKILGYENHSAYALQNQMAKHPKAAFSMLTDLAPTVVAKARREAAEIQALMKAEGATFDLKPWDWEFYAEKVRKAKYSVDESEVKPFFELESVLQNGVFYTMNQLYGVSFKERKDLPVYCEGVRVFDVFDSNNQQLGLFYADYYQRESKRGGAWMSAFVNQSGLRNEKPVVINVLNIPRPASGEPTLLTYDMVTTLFHEMGHALHGLFSDVHYPALAGTNVPRDFVEFPSTFHEDFAIRPDVLNQFARHHKTGQTIPSELLDRVLAANKFNKGFDTLEYLSAALLDLEWHSLSEDQIPSDIEAFEAATLKKYGVDFEPVPPRYRTAYFAHIWPGGYSASYYAYLWSEVLAADAYDHMKAIGGMNRENGLKFRKSILSTGGSREPMQSYIDFRGKEPSVDGLLIRRGLKKDPAG